MALTLKQFKIQAQWSPGSGLDSAANYSGPDLSEFLKGPARSRDSGILEQSNFEVALEMLGGESNTVTVERFGHWACGWFEQILVASCDAAAVQKLFEIYQALEAYPVLDEGHFYEMQSEACAETFDQNEIKFSRTVCETLGLEYDDVAESTAFKSLVSLVYEEDRAYHGDEEAWVTPEAVYRAVRDGHYIQDIQENPYFQYARTCFGLDLEVETGKAVL